MSGYLQRMVTSAARREQALKPLVGGLFAREPLPVEEATTTIAPQRAESTRESRRLRAQGEVVEPNVSPVVEERLVEQRIESTRADSSTHPQIPVAKEQKRREHEEYAVETATQQRISEPVEPLVQERAEVSNAVEKIVVVRSLERERLVVQEAQHDEGWAEEATASEEPKSSMQGMPRAMVRAARVEPREPIATAQESRRGAEDVHIHIGRIEVVAVPQPVQRATPVAARRGESLEEYLKRRDRRAR